MTFIRTIAGASQRMVAVIFRYRRMLVAITKIELAKRHAGSVLGFSWVVLQPALLLSVYVFVYMVVLRMRFEGFSRFDYVLYVFCGLVPYLGFMEALTTGGDRFMLLADYASYVACQERVDALYQNPDEWARLAILNVIAMGKFSSDRAIHEYAERIWKVKPVSRAKA